MKFPLPLHPLRRTARFWEFINGDLVKISLKYGQELTWTNFHQHEEGYSSEVITWKFIGGSSPQVIRISSTRSTDCDGRYSGEFEEFCLFIELRGLSVEGEDQCFPEWQKVKELRRDYSAERMNY